MFKQFNTLGVEYLTKVLNLSLYIHKVPEAWEMSRMVLLLKAGNDANKGASYRRISLLSLVAKTLGDQVLPSYPFTNYQFGFRPQHNTITALHAIPTHIIRGLNNALL